MSDLDGLINLIPIGDIAKKLGIDESVARTAVTVAVPAIVGGLAANAQKGGAESLQNALNHHVDKPTDIDKIDTEDGAKIVKNVFGAKTDDVVAAVADKADVKSGVDIGAIVQQILPIIAPIVLAYLANQFAQPKEEAKKETKATESSSTGGDLGSLIGGLLGSQQGQDIVGGLLGGLLGGGRK